MASAATTRTLTDLSGPKGLPLLGNLLQLDLKQLHRVLERWSDEFGTLYKFELGRRPVVVVTDPELNQTILRNRPKLYRRLGTIEPVFKDMGITGVFSAEGEDWKRQRRMTAHALDAQHLRQFFPTLIKVTQRLRNRWNTAAARESAVDVQQDLMRYTVDVTTNLAFGYDMNTLEKAGDVIQEHLEKIFPLINRRINAVFPYWRHFKLPADRALDQSLVAIRETITGFVTRGRARLAAHPELAAHPTNLLEAMLAAPLEGDAAFTDEEIYGNVLTMLLAGEDTTANTMAWMIHFMIEHPEAQARMRAEAGAVVGSAGMLSQLADAERLNYIEAVTNETMRLKPVAPILFLESNEDVEIGGVAVPKGTALFLLTLHGGLQDIHFGAADQFRPERWLATAPAAGCPHNAKAFIPFGTGPRFCPGRQLAMVEIKTVMAMLCTEFEVAKTEHSQPVTEVFSFTMMPENLLVRFQRRPAA
ncbi:MAG: cytochrome P450 [Verrucomicrobia bacterium]|nr:cytochrome P450 [Verrucomicrobiota bacterium]